MNFHTSIDFTTLDCNLIRRNLIILSWERSHISTVAELFSVTKGIVNSKSHLAVFLVLLNTTKSCHHLELMLIVQFSAVYIIAHNQCTNRLLFGEVYCLIFKVIKFHIPILTRSEEESHSHQGEQTCS